ncbi:MAG: hypothetical protein R3E79_30480 [Caldilineaceae bacterium]
MSTAHLHLRDARDRLFELLGLGQPYPLPDLPLGSEQIKVAFNTTAKIAVANSQRGVRYQLHYKHEVVERTPQGDWVKRTPAGKWLKRTAQGEWADHTPKDENDVGEPIELDGDGATLLLETCKIQEDITFEIFAQKQRSGKRAYLHQTANIKVGLDTDLPAQIIDAALLEPGNDQPTAPRIVAYGQTTTVAIQHSQEGVVYDLVTFPDPTHEAPTAAVALSGVQEGNLHTLTLVTQPLYEDTELRIRVTKTFEGAVRSAEVELLTAKLPVKVRANPDLAVTVEPTPIVDFQGQATLLLSATQRSARYQLFQRALRDRDFIHQPAPDKAVMRVSVSDAAPVQVANPASDAIWNGVGYTAVGEPQAGSDGELRFPLPALTTDALLLVGVEKAHLAQAAQAEQPARQVASRLQLTQAALVLVRPDPAPPLRLQVWLTDAGTTGELLVTDGQPGVFYAFRLAPDGAELGLPAYFHQRDDQDNQVNKGLEQLALEVDLVVARDPAEPLAGDDLAQKPPAPPLVMTGPLPVGASLQVRATKAQTGVSTLLNTPYQLPSGPEVTLAEAVVDFGGKTSIRMKSSAGKGSRSKGSRSKSNRTEEFYQLFLDGNPLGDPVGRERLLETPPLTQDAIFDLVITPDDPTVMIRVLRLPVLVRPDPTLAVTAAESVVAPDTATVIHVEKSQAGVSYQLWVGEQSVGEAVAGGAERLALPTGTLTAETTFAVRATRTAYSELSVLLAQSVTVQVKAAETDPATATDPATDNATPEAPPG